MSEITSGTIEDVPFLSLLFVLGDLFHYEFPIIVLVVY